MCISVGEKLRGSSHESDTGYFPSIPMKPYTSKNFAAWDISEGPQLPKILYKIVQSLKFSKDCKIVMKDCNLT